jgi:hypothetical protein
MVYKPVAVKVALIAGLRQALSVFDHMIVVEAVGVESRLHGFPPFPYPGISMACLLRVT